MPHMPISPDAPLVVYTVSDASGQTAEMVVKAAISQFRGHPVRIVRLPRVVSDRQLANMVKLAMTTPSMFAYTIARPDLRETIEREARRAQIPAVDLMGPLLAAVGGALGAEPRQEVGLLQTKDEDYFRRMDAIDFAIKYDDGKSPHGLLEADMVLVGVSRTSKTPTCMYLAQNQGLKCANVPLVPGAEPPRELYQLPADKVIGLTLKPAMLTEIRTSRLSSLGLPPESPYASKVRIQEELSFANRLFQRLGCQVVDVTNKAVEETASEILAMTRKEESFL